MKNREIEAAWHYHNGTKHPGGYLMNTGHRFDYNHRPRLFKEYLGLKTIPLVLDNTPGQMPALAAIAANVPSAEADKIPSIGDLIRLLYFSAGITKRISYPQVGQILFRAAACTGALYHIELYLVCGDLPGLPAGVYHFDPQQLALGLLRQGDYRPVLVAATGHEQAVVHAPAILIYTDVAWRNACKYQAREYRHAFWDSGTILSQTLALAGAYGFPAKVISGFVDETVNSLLALPAKREVALTLLPTGYQVEPAIGPAPDVRPLSLPTKPISEREINFPAIDAMHQASSLETAATVREWRGQPPAVVVDHSVPTLEFFPLKPVPGSDFPSEPLETVIQRRGSTRQFARRPIRLQELATVLHQALAAVPADFLEAPGATLNTPFLIVNAVEDLPSGAYVFDRQQQALALFKRGNFRDEAGYLALNQALAADASVNIFFLADLKSVLARFGNRGYRAAQLEASITAGRVYLAAYAQHFGATGLTFFDDAVSEFFAPLGRELSVMFLVALGHKQPR